MTTKHSPIKFLKAQADRMAEMLKAAERGEKIGPWLVGRMAEARGKDSVSFAVAMDDKIIRIEMLWETIANTSEEGLSKFIVDQMLEKHGGAKQ